MSETITVPEDERDIVRVFRVDLPEGEARQFAEAPEDARDEITDWPLKKALGASHLDPAQVDTFRVADLTGVGLVQYLTEGQGLDPDDLAGAKERLQSADGQIVVVRSAAFGGNAQTLKPAAPLQHLGTFKEIGSRRDPVAMPHDTKSETGVGQVDEPGALPGEPANQRMILIAALAAALIVLLLAL